jgi:hypothetical protein
MMKRLSLLLIVLFSSSCFFFDDYPIARELRDIRVDSRYPRPFFRYNWDIIELTSCQRSDFEHELAHYTMKRVGWSMEESLAHNWTFYATLRYVKENRTVAQ